MSTAVHAWDFRCTVAGTETDVARVSVSHAIDQPIGTASLDLPLPLPSWVDAGADVVVTATIDGLPLAAPLFVGTYRDPDRNYTATDKGATLLCQGPCYKMGYPFDKDVVFAGGARATPITLSLGATYLHLGTRTVSWYADTSPDGTTIDRTFTPAIDSNFLWIAGRLHGTNSYDASTGDDTIKDHSRIEIRQGGQELGRAFFPESSEQWSSTLDYTNDANWTDFEVFIACDPPIDAAGGAVTVRFHAGHKPGSSDYDEFEVKAVTYQTAGKTSVRNIVRGLFSRAGFHGNSKSVNEVTDMDGITVYLGGNGKVEAGQIVMSETDTPISFANRVANLFGFWVFDAPDGIPRCRPVRGVPSGTPSATFVEGVSGFSFRSRTDASRVFNKVIVEGASGTDANRKQFAYRYETASPPTNGFIPSPPGVNTLRLATTLLTSNGRCEQVGEIAESSNSDQTFVEWESWPHALPPAAAVRVTAPTVGIDALVFLTAVRHDLSAQGFRSSYTGWKGVAASFNEIDDPDPTEVDREPTDPRPRTRPHMEWRPYVPLASVN